MSLLLAISATLVLYSAVDVLHVAANSSDCGSSVCTAW